MAIPYSDLLNIGTGITRTALQRRATGSAVDNITSGIDQATQTQKDLLDQQKQLYNPYITAGQQGLQRFTDLSLNPAQYNNPFVAPTGEQVRATPGYQLGLDEGVKARLHQGAAAGILGGGAIDKALTKFGTDYADTKYQDAWNRALQEHGVDESTFFQNADRQVQGARDLTQIGQTGVAGMANANEDYAKQLTDLQQQKADALATGDLAKAKELDNAIAGLSNTAGDIIDGVVGKNGVVSYDQLGNAIKSGIGSWGGGVSTYDPVTGKVTQSGTGLLGGVRSGVNAVGQGISKLGSVIASNPFIAAGVGAAAVGAKLWMNSQAHRQADKLTGEGGIQYNLNHDLETLANEVKSGSITQEEADPLRQQAFQTWADQALQFGNAGDKKQVVLQMLSSYDWDPALKDLAAQYRQRLENTNSNPFLMTRTA